METLSVPSCSRWIAMATDASFNTIYMRFSAEWWLAVRGHSRTMIFRLIRRFNAACHCISDVRCTNVSMLFGLFGLPPNVIKCGQIQSHSHLKMFPTCLHLASTCVFPHLNYPDTDCVLISGVIGVKASVLQDAKTECFLELYRGGFG